MALKHLLPLAHRCVANREATKSLLIKTVHQFREAYKILGEKMAHAGIIPESRVIWFLTHSEIERILEPLSAQRTKFVRKAMRRRQLFGPWDKVGFPEIIAGNPVQIEEKMLAGETAMLGDGGGGSAVVVSGTPACPGKVTGRAKVVRHISDAANIQPGDVLITHSTDIGWSPYFPILSGVVTELGGLISHGAVVAREYGLPCLVGVGGATKQFKDGDIVSLDAIKGLLSKVDK